MEIGELLRNYTFHDNATEDKYVGVIAYEDEAVGDASENRKKILTTDASLPKPKQTDVRLTDAEQKELEEYRIVEESLTELQKVQLLAVLKQCQSVIAINDYDLGYCNVAKHRIDTGDHPPISTPPHTMPLQLRPVLRKELDELIAQDIIEPSLSPWASPIVYVKKKDGSWRLCVDFRKLNAIAKTCAYPLPRINDLLSIMAGSRFFSTIDLAKGFWQIGLDEESKEKTSFTTVFGQFQYKRLPFGLATAPGAFQKVLETVLAGLVWVKCLVYIDDILVFSSTWEEHLAILTDVFTRLIKADLKIKLKKCEFARTECLYLGHILNAGGISPDPSKVSAIKELQPPTCIKEVETFLGKVGYYGRFIDHLSTIAKPLFELKKKGAEWKFGETELQAFEYLKKCLITAPVLKHPVFDKTFLIQTDASGFGFGAVLSQNFDDGEHPISYASRTLLGAETRYAVIEKEGTALYWGIEHFQEYLLGAPFVAFTDHKPLLALRTKDLANKRLQNIALKLQHYEFEIRYRKGIENGNADFLSRIPRHPVMPLKGKRTKEIQAEQDEAGSWVERELPKFKKVTEADRTVAILAANDIHRPEPGYDRVRRAWNNFAQLQREEPTFLVRIRYLEDGALPEDPVQRAKLLKEIDGFIIDENELLIKFISRKPLFCVPAALRESVLKKAHDYAQAGHGGIAKTYGRLIQKFWWPGMNKAVLEYIRNCPLCTMHKAVNRHPRQPLGARPIPDRVWQRVHVDIWEPGGKSNSGQKCVIAFVDVLSKYVIAVPAVNKKAHTVINKFFDHVQTVFGFPEELVSDGGPEFTSLLHEEIFRVSGVTRTIVTPYHPQANGQIERFFRTLRPMLSILAHKRPRVWDKVLPHAIFAYNTSFNAVIQNTPFYLMFGRDPQDWAADCLQQEDYAQTVAERLEQLSVARVWAKAMIRHHQDQNKAYYDANRARPQNYQVGDVVFVKIGKRVGPVAKLVPKYVGPFRVADKVGEVLMLTPLAYPNREPKPLHADRVRRGDENRVTQIELEVLDLPWVEPEQPVPRDREPEPQDTHSEPEPQDSHSESEHQDSQEESEFRDPHLESELSDY